MKRAYFPQLKNLKFASARRQVPPEDEEHRPLQVLSTHQTAWHDTSDVAWWGTELSIVERGGLSIVHRMCQSQRRKGQKHYSSWLSNNIVMY